MTELRMTDAEFTQLSWHDNAIYGIAFYAGEPDENDWASDLILDIDYIVEWLCPTEGAFQFKVAPAWLVFHDVFEHEIAMAQKPSFAGVPVIDRIEREFEGHLGISTDIANYRWTIHLNYPENGLIRFLAPGFTQTLRAEPILQDGLQSIAPSKRRALLGEPPWSVVTKRGA